MEETIFPTWDLTMISVDLYDKSKELKVLVEAIKNVDFPNKWETIANITLAMRHIEDAESRILKAKQNIIEASNIKIDDTIVDTNT